MEGYPGSVTTFDWDALLWEPIRNNGGQLASLLPGIINALYILLLGWILAFVVQFVFRKILDAIGFEKIAETTGIAGVLNENGVAAKPAMWLSRLMYWGVMITAIVKALYELRLGDLAGGLDLFTMFVFQSVGLLVIFIIGLFLSVVLSKIVHATSTNLKIKTPQVYSRIMKWAVLTFMFLLIFRQIAMPINFVLIVLGAIFASLCVTFIIAFGVGGAGWAAKMLDKISK